MGLLFSQNIFIWLHLAEGLLSSPPPPAPHCLLIISDFQASILSVQYVNTLHLVSTFQLRLSKHLQT